MISSAIEDTPGGTSTPNALAVFRLITNCLDVTVAADIENDELLPDRLSCGLQVSSLRLGIGGVRVHEHGNCRRLGHELAQQLQSLRPQYAEKDQARDVAPRPVEACNEAVPDRVAPGRKDDRHRRGCGPGRERRRGVPDDYGQIGRAYI